MVSKDDRFRLQARSLEEGLIQRVTQIESIPDAFWKRVTSDAGLSGKASAWELRHLALSPLYQGAGYLDRNGYVAHRRSVAFPSCKSDHTDPFKSFSRVMEYCQELPVFGVLNFGQKFP